MSNPSPNPIQAPLRPFVRLVAHYHFSKGVRERDVRRALKTFEAFKTASKPERRQMVQLVRERVNDKMRTDISEQETQVRDGSATRKVELQGASSSKMQSLLNEIEIRVNWRDQVATTDSERAQQQASIDALTHECQRQARLHKLESSKADFEAGVAMHGIFTHSPSQRMSRVRGAVCMAITTVVADALLVYSVLNGEPIREPIYLASGMMLANLASAAFGLVAKNDWNALKSYAAELRELVGEALAPASTPRSEPGSR